MAMIDRAYEIYNLLSKHLKEELSDEEKTQLNDWVNQSDINKALFLEISNPESLKKAVLDYYKIAEEPETEESGEGEMGNVVNVYVKGSNRARYYMAAAAVLLLVLAGLWVWLRPLNSTYEKGGVEQKLTSDINPGKYGAKLTLATGETILLDSLANDTIVKQGSTRVLNKEGKLVYEGDNSEVLFNTISTARGQTYLLILNDGSRVWLNSESSIRFPVSFTGNQRRVQMTGEIYIDVTHKKEQPFIVSVNGMDAEVLGTTFDIKAYSDAEAIKTTLLEGSVKIKKGNNQVMIKPGQQAEATENQIIVKSDIALDQVVGWKDGFIYMDNEKLPEIMKDVARWYNIEVVYIGNAKELEMIGRINRNANLSEFIKLLSASNIDVDLEGNKLTLKAQ